MYKFATITFAILLVFAPRDVAFADDPPTLKQLLKQKPYKGDRRLRAVRSFVSYHSSPQLKFTVKDEDGRVRKHVQNRILLITWFLDDGRAALRYAVTESGNVRDIRVVHSWAFQDGRDKQLTNEQLKTLHDLISRLPKSTAAPPINRTVYVSLLNKMDWRTETYDSEELPEEFESVLEILGERFETRDRKRPKAK